MIPVRIPGDTRPPRATLAARPVAMDHPLADERCPVCDGTLGGTSVHLIVVGNEPRADQLGKAWITGAAVAVHEACTLPAPESPAGKA